MLTNLLYVSGVAQAKKVTDQDPSCQVIIDPYPAFQDVSDLDFFSNPDAVTDPFRIWHKF